MVLTCGRGITSLNYTSTPDDHIDRMSTRLHSLDALRGFSMLWIIGADTLVHLLAASTDFVFLDVASNQLTHVSWQGLHAYDLVFPVFMFVSGVSLALSHAIALDRGSGTSDFLWKAAQRAFLLVILGVVYNFGWDVSVERFRVASVLG